ncbi:MAG: helix-turn-helix domain-containing protein [Clostridia bacterium]|nr:helix-turn-helix domain-containing protein [Clostridia bacterium]
MNVTTAERLLQFRKKNGYSQEELAEKIGVSRQAISKWERSESSPDTDNLIALAKLYQVSVDELLNIQTDSNEIPAPTEEEAQEPQPEQPAQEEQDAAEEEKPDLKRRSAVSGAILCCGVIAFLLTGFLLDWWAFSWTFILFAISINTLIDAIYTKKANHFAYPILVVAVFCLIGIAGGIWHPTWVLFITIPLYYFLCDVFKKKKG